MPSTNPRILVVDDLEDNLFLLQTVLEAEGYVVELADRGQAALTAITTQPPDLVLLDAMMPDISGYEVIQQVRQELGLTHLPILLITAYEASKAIEAIALGANGFIGKPIDFDALLTQVKDLLCTADTQNLSCSS
jgi:CheY-like chemotaxis protein